MKKRRGGGLWKTPGLWYAKCAREVYMAVPKHCGWTYGFLIHKVGKPRKKKENDVDRVGSRLLIRRVCIQIPAQPRKYCCVLEQVP